MCWVVQNFLLENKWDEGHGEGLAVRPFGRMQYNEKDTVLYQRGQFRRHSTRFNYSSFDGSRGTRSIFLTMDAADGCICGMLVLGPGGMFCFYLKKGYA